MLTDTHCHIHEPSYPLDQAETLEKAREAGVERLICVGTNEQSSREAVEFAAEHDGVFASIGVHPHDTKDGWGGIGEILRANHDPRTVPSQNGFAPGLTGAPAPGQPGTGDVLTQEGSSARSTAVSSRPLAIKSPETSAARDSSDAGARFESRSEAVPGDFGGGVAGEQENKRNKLVAIGEIGLDYFYMHSSRDMQIRALEEQIELALMYDLPVIFHVREAFDDFWPIFDNFHGIRGELHSFTDNQKNLEEGLKRGLYIGVNGISTFTKDSAQQEAFANIPLKRMLFETDAPFLTPVPLRGKVNEPAFVRLVAEHHARLRGISLEEIAVATTANAQALFSL